MSSAYGEGLTLRRGLIIFQLFIAQGLVIITIIITQQINHFMAQPLGINSEAVVEFLLPEIISALSLCLCCDRPLLKI